MEITKQMIKKEVAFHCDTVEKAKEFLGKLKNLRYTWANGKSYSFCCYFGDKTCYYPYEGVHGTVGFYKNNNYKIIEYELDKKEFTLDDIKDGYLIETRDGERYLCCNSIDDKKIFARHTGFINTIFYRLDLIYENFSKYDIVKIYDRSSKYFNLLSLETDYRKLLWERKEENKMELNDTVEMMNSEDFKERFKAEYIQTKIRYDKIDDMTVKYEAGALTFEPSCSLKLLKEQKEHMGMHIRCLKIRAEIEGIDLP